MAKKTPIDQGMISRAVSAVRGWFGPGEPIAPVAPPATAGRAFDYPVAVNTVISPRNESGDNGINFVTLRALADPTQGGLDLLRLAIETRKDQMETQQWVVRGRDKKNGGAKAEQVMQALRRPDGIHTWSQWQRMLLEDLLVIDAPAVYLAPSTKGYLVPQVMDGATLKCLVALDGRTPLPPEPAFSQVLKGFPAAEYTLDELVYLPRNLRSHRIYGMSPVEQVISSVNIALRRQLSQLEYYTAGSVPDVVFGVPEAWSADQIRQFQVWWDSILAGNTEERRRARFVPGGVTPVELKPDALKDLFDEWLARIICYAFNLSPQALVKETNRATAQTSKETAQEEGLEPLKRWWKDLVDQVLERGFLAPELELAYLDEEIPDPAVKAEVFAIALGKGGGKPWMTQDEVREKYGEPPLTPEQREELTPAPPPQLQLPAPEQTTTAEAIKEMAKAMRVGARQAPVQKFVFERDAADQLRLKE